MKGIKGLVLILKLKDNRDWCKLSKAALGRAGKVDLFRTESQRSGNCS